MHATPAASSGSRQEDTDRSKQEQRPASKQAQANNQAEASHLESSQASKQAAARRPNLELPAVALLHLIVSQARIHGRQAGRQQGTGRQASKANFSSSVP